MRLSKQPLRYLFLYTRLPDYFLQCIVQLLKTSHPDAKAWIVSYEADKDAPYTIDDPTGQITFLQRSTFNQRIVDESIEPNIIYMAGWGDKLYNSIAKTKRNDIPIVMGMDNPWKGNYRQYLACLLSRFFVRKICTHMWVTGVPQYEYARRLGFAPSRIIRGLYCAKAEPRTDTVTNLYNHRRILFVGRLVAYKHPDWLLTAFTEIISYKPELDNWKVAIIGQGPLKDELKHKYKEYPQVEFFDFLQPEEVKKAYLQADFFCFPSHGEHWGVVVQEAAAAGLPLLLSDSCGAASEFLVDGYNGYQFKSNHYEDFKKKLYLLMTAESSDLQQMGKASETLSNRITHESWVASLNSLLRDD